MAVVIMDIMSKFLYWMSLVWLKRAFLSLGELERRLVLFSLFCLSLIYAFSFYLFLSCSLFLFLIFML
jgi:hypothetical protein